MISLPALERDPLQRSSIAASRSRLASIRSSSKSGVEVAMIKGVPEPPPVGIDEIERLARALGIDEPGDLLAS